MPPRRTRRQSAASPPPVSREAYNAFIEQIELVNLWLKEARVANHAEPWTVPEQGIYSIEPSASWQLVEDGFRALSRNVVRLVHQDTTFLEVDVTYAVEYRSAQPMTEAIFAVFEDVNLPLNAWPYLREFVSTTLGRMGWLPYTMPAFKVGVKASEADKPARRRSSRQAVARG